MAILFSPKAYEFKKKKKKKSAQTYGRTGQWRENWYIISETENCTILYIFSKKENVCAYSVAGVWLFVTP